MRPVVSGLDQKYGDRVRFAAVDYNSQNNATLVRQYEVFSHPTFIVVGADGSVVERFSGYIEERELDAAIQKALNTSS